jgi:UDP-N-acetylmuramoylalanine--D-glutamate ligase
MRLVILGGGESGIGTAILGKQKGYEVFVSDFGKIKDKYKQVLIDNEIAFEEEKHTESLILNADMVMKSPGIPDKVPILKKLIEKGIKIVSEIEFAITYTTAKTIGITGSNGKTTTTMRTYHLLQKAGLNVGLGGNIGKSFAWQVATENFDFYVLEISSFQLDGCFDYRPDIAIITNLSPDHLDRYDYKYENYIAAKFRITQSQTEEDYLIYDYDDPEIAKWLQNNETKARLVPFSLTQTIEYGAFIKNNTMEININAEEFEIETTEISLEGRHNHKNAMASCSVATLLGIRKKTIREGVMDFQGVEHRLEKVLKIDGVQYINDSKATNVNSAFFALESMASPTIWIMGGVDKGNDYDELRPLVFEKVKAIICLGVDNKKIINSFNNIVDVMIEVDNMEDAVKVSQRLAEKGDTVLLSPCCASFDLFDDYEDRGKQFKQYVRGL